MANPNSKPLDPNAEVIDMLDDSDFDDGEEEVAEEEASDNNNNNSDSDDRENENGEEEQWACPQCTLMNVQPALYCLACGTRRKRKKSSSQSGDSNGGDNDEDKPVSENNNDQEDLNNNNDDEGEGSGNENDDDESDGHQQSLVSHVSSQSRAVTEESDSASTLPTAEESNQSRQCSGKIKTIHKRIKRRKATKNDRRIRKAKKKLQDAAVSASGNLCGCYVLEVGKPTKKERRKFQRQMCSNSTASQQVTGDGAAAVTYSKAMIKPNKLWDWLLPGPDPYRTIEEEQPLSLHISVRTPGRPVILKCDQVEPATPDTLTYKPKPLPSTPRPAKLCHELFASPWARGIYGDTTSESPRQRRYDNNDDGSVFAPDQTLADLGAEPKQKPKIEEWFPIDPSEYILNPIEVEVAWLGEESKHCLRTRDFHWEYFWEYASPALKVELRRLEDGDDGVQKLHGLVRMSEPLVRERFGVVQKDIRILLNIGFRRLQMKKAMAQLRFSSRNQQQDKDKSSNNNATKKWKFPPVDLEAAVGKGYSYKDDQAQNNSTRGANRNKKQRTR